MDRANDLTIAQMGLISSPSAAFGFVKQYYETKNTGLVSVLRLNDKSQVVGIAYNKTDIDLAWRAGVVYDATQDQSCSKIVVVYEKPQNRSLTSFTQQEVDSFSDLKKKLDAVQVSLVDIIAVGKDKIYSFAREATLRIQ